MPFCRNCGFEISQNAKFCPECGAPSAPKDITTPEQSSSGSGKTQRRVGQPTYGVLNLEDLPPGHIIDDRYEIKEKLGQGGFGAVYRAYDRSMDVDKALKVLPEVMANDREAMLDLRSEAKAMVVLNHPNIVRVYDFHDTGAIKYIDMEYVAGKTLTDIKLEYPDKRVPEDKVKEVALQMAAGLAYAHDQGVIHKDIKPQNIMVTAGGQVKIMDFGIAEKVRMSMSRVAQTSSSGTLVYMSPEQLLGEDIGKEADIYSFGAVLYELLSGHPPFYKGDIQYQIMNKLPDEIKEVSQPFNEMILGCLSKDYRGRPTTQKTALLMLGSELASSQQARKKKYHRAEKAHQGANGTKESADILLDPLAENVGLRKQEEPAGEAIPFIRIRWRPGIKLWKRRFARWTIVLITVIIAALLLVSLEMDWQHDAKPIFVGEPETIIVQPPEDAFDVTYRWSIIDLPDESLLVPVFSSSSNVFTFTADMEGGFAFAVSVESYGEDVAEHVMRFRAMEDTSLVPRQRVESRDREKL